MKRGTSRGWLIVLAVNVFGLCVLGLYGSGSAAPHEAKEPFANAVEQRAEIIAQLKAVVAELKEQNDLLQSGKLTVVVNPDKKT